MAIDPIAGDQLLEQATIETPDGAQVDILDDGSLAQGRELEPGDQPLVLTRGDLALEQQRQALLEGKRLDVGLAALLVERLGHAGEAKAQEALVGGPPRSGAAPLRDRIDAAGIDGRASDLLSQW